MTCFGRLNGPLACARFSACCVLPATVRPCRSGRCFRSLRLGIPKSASSLPVRGEPRSDKTCLLSYKLVFCYTIGSLFSQTTAVENRCWKQLFPQLSGRGTLTAPPLGSYFGALFKPSGQATKKPDFLAVVRFVVCLLCARIYQTTASLFLIKRMTFQFVYMCLRTMLSVIHVVEIIRKLILIKTYRSFHRWDISFSNTIPI